MPKSKTTKPAKGQGVSAKLAKLPRSSELVIEGGKRTLGIYIQENEEMVRPQLAIWMEADTGFVRGARIMGPSTSGEESLKEALQVLVEALVRPVPAMFGTPLSSGPLDRGILPSPQLPAPQPGLPAKIKVNDPDLAQAARNLFAPLDVPVEYTEQLPAFEEAFEEISEVLGADDDAEPPEPFAWEIDEKLLPALFKAAAGFWRRAPWDYLGSDIPIAVELGENGPEPGVNTLYATILGNGGTVFGIGFYFSLEGIERTLQRGMAQLREDLSMDVDAVADLLRQAGAPVDEVPPEELRQMLSELIEQAGPLVEGDRELLETLGDSMVLYFDFEEETDPTYLKWLHDRRLRYASPEAVPSFFRTTPDSGPVEPNAREVKALTLAIDALNQFFSAHGKLLERMDMQGSVPSAANRITHTAQIGEAKAKAARLAIEVSLPPEGYEDPDEC
jgi:hypothetical protein